MGLVVNTNIGSLNAQRNLAINDTSFKKSLERLSSGLRINRAGDDAAGLAIANKLRAQVLGLDQAQRNANDGISLIQTAEGALNVVTGILNRLKELAVQSASETTTDSDRTAVKTEADQLVAELSRISEATEFNGMALLDGTFSAKKMQIGASADQTISVSLSDSRAKAMGKYASTTANVGDGISSPTANGAGGLVAGEFTITGTTNVVTNVAATTDTDDQVSVLSLNSTAVAGAAVSGTSSYNASLITASLYINGTLINMTAMTGSTVGSFATDVAALVNTANITGVTARVIETSMVVLEATGGRNLQLYAVNSTATGTFSLAGDVASALGIGSAFVGSLAAGAVTTYNGQSSAIAKAAAINAVKSVTGVSAAIEDNSMTGTDTIAAGSISTGDLVINGVNIGAVTVVAGDSNGALVGAINAQSSNTGVVASVTSGKLTLKAASGRNISITASDAVQNILDTATTFGTASYTGATTIIRSSMTMKSTNNFTIGGSTNDIGGITTTTYVASGNLAAMDVSTRSGANTAITQLDSALNAVNSMRANIGAIQNRMEMLIKNLQTASENQAGAESRIRDADFAMETALLTRNQILIQAGTAILAQANTSSQVALQLLR